MTDCSFTSKVWHHLGPRLALRGTVLCCSRMLKFAPRHLIYGWNIHFSPIPVFYESVLSFAECGSFWQSLWTQKAKEGREEIGHRSFRVAVPLTYISGLFLLKKKPLGVTKRQGLSGRVRWASVKAVSLYTFHRQAWLIIMAFCGDQSVSHFTFLARCACVWGNTSGFWIAHTNTQLSTFNGNSLFYVQWG